MRRRKVKRGDPAQGYPIGTKIPLSLAPEGHLGPRRNVLLYLNLRHTPTKIPLARQSRNQN
jgi:hypothetical protein